MQTAQTISAACNTGQYSGCWTLRQTALCFITLFSLTFCQTPRTWMTVTVTSLAFEWHRNSCKVLRSRTLACLQRN